MHSNLLLRRQHGKEGGWEHVVVTWIFCCLGVVTFWPMSILVKQKELRWGLAPFTAGSIVSLNSLSTNWQIKGHICFTVWGRTGTVTSVAITQLKRSLFTSAKEAMPQPASVSKKPFLNRFRCHIQKMLTGQARAHSDLEMLQILEGHWSSKDQNFGAFIIMQNHHCVTLYHSYILRYKSQYGRIELLDSPSAFLNTCFHVIKSLISITFFKWWNFFYCCWQYFPVDGVIKKACWKFSIG